MKEDLVTVYIRKKLLNEIKNRIGKERYLRIRWKALELKNKIRFKYRLLTSESRSLPSGLIVGAMKSGTTSLYKNLTKYPSIHGPTKKEVHFFGENYKKGVNWYKAHFPMKEKVSGGEVIEATPKYIFSKGVPKQIKEVVPKAKIIMILRNPVNRAISHYMHEVRAGREKRPMKKAIKENMKRVKKEKKVSKDVLSHFSYLERGEYFRQIKRYINWFTKEKMKIVKSERMFREKSNVTKEVAEFLTGRRMDKVDCEKHNAGDYNDSKYDEVKRMLREYYIDKNRNLYDLIGRDLEWEN